MNTIDILVLSSNRLDAITVTKLHARKANLDAKTENEFVLREKRTIENILFNNS